MPRRVPLTRTGGLVRCETNRRRAICCFSFGPGTPITFNYLTTVQFDSLAFTVGVAEATPAPVPGTAWAALMLLGGLGAYNLARRKAAPRAA